MKGLDDMCNALSVLGHELGIDFILVGVIYHEKKEQLEVAVGSNVTNKQVRTEAMHLAVQSIEEEPEAVTRIH